MTTLLRADGAAIVALQGDSFRTVFACRLEPALDWPTVIGGELLRKTLADASVVATSVPAGRWGDTSAYGLIAVIEGPDGSGRGLLCALRKGVPFDAIEVDAARAAADLLQLTFTEGRPSAAESSLAPRSSTPLRVLAIEDHPAMRLGIEAMLRDAGCVVSLSGTCADALQRLGESPCDAILLDLGLPDANGVEAIERLRAGAPHAPIVVFSVDRSPDLVRSALRAGATGYLGKDAPVARVVSALHAAVNGLAVISSESVGSVVRPNGPAERAPSQAAPRANGDGAAALEPLSPRELELLRYLAEGYTNKQIARVMVLADDTVKKGVQGLIAKLGATDRTHAVVIAIRSGLIE